MHAKYELLRNVTSENPFRTIYFCWLDIGLFRDISSGGNISNPTKGTGPKFSLYLPLGFQNDSIAYNQVNERDRNMNIDTVVRTDTWWINGGFFIGDDGAMHRWTTEYLAGVEKMLDWNPISTDQQVIYFIFNELNRRLEFKHTLELVATMNGFT